MTKGTASISSSPFRLVPCLLLLLLCISACSAFLQGRIPSATSSSTSLCMSTPATFPRQGSRTWNQKPRDQGHSVGGDNSNNKAALLVTPPPENTNGKRVRIKTKPMPVTGYNAKAIEDYYDRQPFQVGWRLNSLGFPLLGTSRTTMNAKDIQIFENAILVLIVLLYFCFYCAFFLRLVSPIVNGSVTWNS